jgi:sialidase-1
LTLLLSSLPLRRFSRLGFGILLLLHSGCSSAAPAAESTLEVRDVFVGGTEGYPAYRIPAILATSRGTLLAFAEGRATLRDHAENDLVLKRSFDRGDTWTPLMVVAEDGTNALNNPTAVVVRETGRILLMHQRYAKGFDERKAEPGLDGPRICRTFLSSSDDDGATWSTPRDITAAVKRPAVVTSTATGPGIGIQLRHGPHAGRLLMPFNQGPYGAWKVYAAISDDRGESWRVGQTAEDTGHGFANEVQMAELPDGSVLLNARNQAGAKTRKSALSKDGGETWSRLKEEPALIDPQCQGSLLAVSSGSLGEVLLFCNAASTTARSNGTVRVSRDQGKTWPLARSVYPGSFAYSCLVSLPEGAVGCLFERDQYARISFVRFPLP